MLERALKTVLNVPLPLSANLVFAPITFASVMEAAIANSVANA